MNSILVGVLTELYICYVLSTYVWILFGVIGRLSTYFVNDQVYET
jgi:hypothetical protein